MQCSVIMRTLISATTSDPYCTTTTTMPCECFVAEVEPVLDTVYAEETISSAEDYTTLVKKWHSRRADAGASFLILHCNVLGDEAEFLRKKFSFKRNTSIHIVYSDVPVGLNLETSSFRETWRMEMKQKLATTVRDPTAVFQGLKHVNILQPSLDNLTLEDLLVMYVPTMFAEFYAHSLSALMNSLHTFTPFLQPDRNSKSSGRVKAPVPPCCLENAVTHSQRARRSERDQALYDSANLVATQLYHGVTSHFGSQVCRELEERGAGIDPKLRIGLEDQTVPFCNLYVARGGEIEPRRGNADGLEIVCWTSYGAPEGGEFVIPALMYKFATGQGSTILFRPNRFYHATLPAENRDSVNEKFAVALIS